MLGGFERVPVPNHFREPALRPEVLDRQAHKGAESRPGEIPSSEDHQPGHEDLGADRHAGMDVAAHAEVPRP